MDARLIERIEAYDKGLTLVKEMKPVTYHYRQGKKDKMIGLVSQDIQILEPLTVIGANHGLVIDHDKLIPILINAIKELSNQVDELKKVSIQVQSVKGEDILNTVKEISRRRNTVK